MNLTKMMGDLFVSIKEWIEPALGSINEKIDEKAVEIGALKQENAELKQKLADIEQKIPEQIDKVAWFEEIAEAIKSQQFITAEDAGLIVEQRAVELKEFLQGSLEEEKAAFTIKNAFNPDDIAHFMASDEGDRIIDNWLNKRKEKICEIIPFPKNGQSVTVEDVLPAIEAKIAEKIAEIPVPMDGKDALQIEILPSVDMEKTYPRGTYALHNGGVIRAYQQTQGEKGWETVQNGIAGTQITQIDARNFTVACRHTDGTVVEQAFAMPAMVYRNVYQEGKDYQQGDVVTFGGSLWHCDKDTQTKPGTKDSDWSLAAKKGRDGKDGSTA